MSYPMPPLTSPTPAAPAAPMPSADPTLPQDDTPAEQAARAAQLAATRAVYVWTTDIPTLPGVPLASDVPKNDEPTIAWFVILIGVGLDIVRNALTVKLGGVDKSELDTPRAQYEAALAEFDAMPRRRRLRRSMAPTAAAIFSNASSARWRPRSPRPNATFMSLC